MGKAELAVVGEGPGTMLISGQIGAAHCTVEHTTRSRWAVEEVSAEKDLSTIGQHNGLH